MNVLLEVLVASAIPPLDVAETNEFAVEIVPTTPLAPDPHVTAPAFPMPPLAQLELVIT